MNSDYIYRENYLTKEECRMLIDYFEAQHVENRQDNNVNPRFNNRVVYYEGVKKNGEIKALMKRVHTDVARILKEFYGEEAEILPEASHLVKWPIGSSLGNHADNAYEDGRPNYVPWRTYSAIIYLNDDYTGGEFYFKKYAYDLKPETGLLVGFTAGTNHIHGVREVTTGTRYAFPMWFCQDRKRAYEN